MNATEEELQEAISRDPEMIAKASGNDTDTDGKQGKQHHRILGAVKGTAKAVAQTAIGANKLRAGTGSKAAKNRVGVVPRKNEQALVSPVQFVARFQGRKGDIYVITEAATPCVSFIKKTLKENKKKLVNDRKQTKAIPLLRIPE